MRFMHRSLSLGLAAALVLLTICAQACPQPDEPQNASCPEHQKRDCCKHGSSDSTAPGQITLTSAILKYSPVAIAPAVHDVYRFAAGDVPASLTPVPSDTSPVSSQIYPFSILRI
jgi:hypothetical protein